MAAFTIGTSAVGSTDPIGQADAAPVALDDGDWLGGVARCFVGIAIALGAQATAQAVQIQNQINHQQQDEFIAPVGPGNFAGGAYATTVRGKTTIFRWGGGGDDWVPPPAASPAFEDDSFQPPKPARDDAQVLVWVDGGGDAIPAAPADEEHAWPPPAPPPILPFLALWQQQDEVFAAAPPPALDDDGAQPRPPPQPAAVLLPLQPDDDVPTLGLTLDHGEWAAAPLPPATPVLAPAHDSGDFLAPKLEDDAWLPLAPVQAPPVLLAAWPDDDLPPQAAGTLVAEDEWLPPQPPESDTSVILWLINDDAVQVAPPEEQYDWPPVAPLQAAPVLLAPVDDGNAQFTAAPTVALEDDAWLPTMPAPARAWVHVAQDQDDLPVLTIDEEAWQPVGAAPGRPWITDQWQHDDLPAPKLDDGDGWAPLVPRAAAPVLALWFGQDEITQPAPPLPVDEFYLWPPLPIMPATISAWVACDSEDVPELSAPPVLAGTDEWIIRNRRRRRG